MNKKVFISFFLAIITLSLTGQQVTREDTNGNTIYFGLKKQETAGKYSKNKAKPTYEVIAPLTPAVGKSEKIKNAIDTAWVPFVLTTIQEYNNEISGSIVVPQRLTIDNTNYPICRVGVQAFKDCYKIKRISLPLSITEIELDAFAGCTSLEEVFLPPNLAKIGTGVFDKCKNLKKIHFYGQEPPETGSHTDFNFRNVTIIVPPNTSDKYREKQPWDIAQIVEREGNEVSYSWFTAEGGQKFLFSVEETEKTASIISYSALTPYIVTEMSYDDISGVLKLPWSINYEDNDYKVVTIGENAFNSCDITELKISSSVEVIGKGAFKNCKSLKYIRIDGNKVDIAADAFDGLPENAILSVPKLSGAYYKSLPACKKFKEIKESMSK